MRPSVAKLVLVSFSGSKMRVLSSCSSELPLAFSTISPSSVKFVLE
jgi:hypothetical protein